MAQLAHVVSNDTGEDLTALVVAAAQANGLPPELLLALAIAESELGVRCQRWGRHTDRARQLLAADDRAGLAELVGLIDQETPGDISFGLFQQTVRWADEGDQSSTLGNVFALRDLYFDPNHATTVAAKRLGAFWRQFGDPLEALCRYNKPSIPGAENPHRARYQECMGRARAFQDDVASPDGQGSTSRLAPFLVAHPELGAPRHTEAQDNFGNSYLWLAPSSAFPKGPLVIWRRWTDQTKIVAWEDGAAELAPGSLETYLAAHPDAGAPRHTPERDVLDNRYVWLTSSEPHPRGALLYWRAWLDASQLVGWES
jgi:hypothetical protein